jgi:hypothetical protein
MFLNLCNLYKTCTVFDEGDVAESVDAQRLPAGRQVQGAIL